MPKLKNRPPRLCKDKCYAIVYCSGTRLAMGKWGTTEADKNYRRFLAEWAVSSTSAVLRPGKKINVEEVLAAYLDWAENNIDIRDFRHAKTVAAVVLNLYAHVPVDDFGPKALAAVQQELEQSGRFSRGYIGKLINRVRTMFRWGVSQELVPVNVAEALKYVLPLRKGKSAAHDTKPRKDVSCNVVESTLPHLPPIFATMVQIQRLAVMRPNEVCRIRGCDIDQSRSDGIWLYKPPNHKGAWREHDRIIPLGKPEQELLAPFLKQKMPEQIVFLTNRGKPYESKTYAGAIKRSITKANKSLPDDKKIPYWTPYQLRHAGVTELTYENDGNRDIARAVAGQKSISVTQRYNHADLQIAIDQAKKRS